MERLRYYQQTLLWVVFVILCLWGGYRDYARGVQMQLSEFSSAGSRQ